MQQKLLLISLLVTIVTLGCQHKKTSEQMPSFRIEVARVEADSVSLNYEFVTHLEGGYKALLQPRVNGYLLWSALQTSKVVKAGELLFVIDASELNTSLRSAQAQLLSAKAKQAEAKSNYERAAPLADIDAISKTQLDQYKTAYLAAEQAVRAAREDVKNAQLQVGYTRIISPINGVAAATAAHVGDYVGAGTQFSTLSTISNMDSLKAELSLPTTKYLQVAGDGRALYDNRDLLSDVTLYLANGEEYKYKGTYDYTRQSISPTAGTITLVVQFPNPEYRLKEGEYARIVCRLGRPVWRVLVPQRAVQSVQGVMSVWVIDKDDVAHYRQIKVGTTHGDDYVVEQGLQPGETVALIGGQKLRDGMKVIPINEK